MTELRPIRADELPAYWRLVDRAFGGSGSSQEALQRVADRFDYERSLAAFEDGTMVGTAGIHSLRLAVPGGDVPLAGVTRVTVLTTHRRRGILTAIMRRQLDDIHARGEPIAALYASEAAIYGRFGYGVGTRNANLEITRARVSFLSAPETAGRVRLIETDEARRLLPPVLERFRQLQPGTVTPTDAMWAWFFADPADRRPGYSEARYAVHEEGGAAGGYAVYRLRAEWGPGGPRSNLQVSHLVACTPAAYGALWRHCLEVDLVETVTAGSRPATEALSLMLADERAIQARLDDGLWLRLVNVDAALAARTYAVEGSLSFEVEDPFCPWNQGGHTLEGGPRGSRCAPSFGEPDIALGAADLATAYLGAVTFHDLAWAGRAEERSPGALARADAMFRVTPPAWCQTHF